MFPRSIRKTFFSAAAALVFASSLPAAQTAPIVSYQGLLTTTAGSPLADAEYQVTFRLYSGSTEMWKETQMLKTANGLFAAALGSVTPFASDFFDKNPSLQLSVQVGSEPEYAKTPLTTVPYASTASYANEAVLAKTAISSYGTGIIGDVYTDKVIARTAGLTLVNKDGQGIVIDKSGTTSISVDMKVLGKLTAGTLEVNNIKTSNFTSDVIHYAANYDLPTKITIPKGQRATIPWPVSMRMTGLPYRIVFWVNVGDDANAEQSTNIKIYRADHHDVNYLLEDKNVGVWTISGRNYEDFYQDVNMSHILPPTSYHVTDLQVENIGDKTLEIHAVGVIAEGIPNQPSADWAAKVFIQK